jgi:uncharacterized cupin superfamily protein
MPSDAFDLSKTYVHLRADATAVAIEDFRFEPEFLAAYEQRFASDRGEGRLVMIGDQDTTWTMWERHPAGDELVVLLEGHVDLIQEIDGEERVVSLHAGQAAINPPGVWHTAHVHEPGRALFITPGRGTEHRPRTNA